MGRNDHPCPICRKNFATCPHSWTDREKHEEDERIRRVSACPLPQSLTIGQRDEVRALVLDIINELGVRNDRTYGIENAL
jgi:hypothetical protein